MARFVVQHIETGLYFRRGQIRSKWDSKLVELADATIYRKESSAIKSAGTWRPFKGDEIKRYKNGLIKQYGTYSLDETVWKIVPVDIS